MAGDRAEGRNSHESAMFFFFLHENLLLIVSSKNDIFSGSWRGAIVLKNNVLHAYRSARVKSAICQILKLSRCERKSRLQIAVRIKSDSLARAKISAKVRAARFRTEMDVQLGIIETLSADRNDDPLVTERVRRHTDAAGNGDNRLFERN